MRLARRVICRVRRVPVARQASVADSATLRRLPNRRSSRARSARHAAAAGATLTSPSTCRTIGRPREPGADGAEVSALNQLVDAQSSVLRGAQTNSRSVTGPGRHRAAVAPTSSIRSPSRTYEALAVTHRYSSPGMEWSRRCSSLPMSTVQKIVSPACASCGTRSRRIVKAAGPPESAADHSGSSGCAPNKTLCGSASPGIHSPYQSRASTAASGGGTRPRTS